AGDQRGFALATLLVTRIEPVPALRGVSGSGLRRIGDEAGMLFGECVHARAGGKVVRRLGATVQHNDQREGLPAITAGNVELVGAASTSVAIPPRRELSAVRHDIGLAR